MRRRRYHVEGTNCLWHVDTNHKMIRWRIIVHGGVDEFSRTLVFLNCSNNNRAATNLSFFKHGVRRYGLPEKVRTDLGGENVDIWRYMVEEHESESSVITGSSTHNQGFRECGVMFTAVSVCYFVIHSVDWKMMETYTLNEVDMWYARCNKILMLMTSTTQLPINDMH